MAVIGSLSVKLGLVTVEWDKATAQAKKQAKDLQAAMRDLGVDLSNLGNLFRNLGGAAGLSVAGITAMSKAVMDMAGQVNDLSASYDLSVGKVLQFQKAIVLAGGKAEDANTILGTLFTKIASAQAGNDATIAQFEELGISFEELKRSSPDQIIKKVYDGLNSIGNTADRIKAVREMIGKAGLGKSLEDVSRILGESTAEFDRQAVALEKWDKMGDALYLTMQNLKMAFAEMFAPFTTEMTISANQFKAAMVAITSAAVVGGMFKLVAAFKALNVALKSTASLGLAISAAGGVKGIAMAGAALATYFGAMAAFESQDEEATEAPADRGEAGSTPMGGKTGGSQAAQARARLSLMKEMLDIDRRRSEYQLAWMDRSQEELKLAESRLKYEEDMLKAKADYAQALEKEGLSSEQMSLMKQEYDLKVAKAQQDYQARDALINAQREKAIALYEQETEFIKARNALTETSLNLETNRRYMGEFEYERAKEMLALEQKLLQIEQDRERLKATRSDKMSPEFVNEMERLNNAEQAAKRETQLRLERIQLNEMEAKDWSAGWEKAMREFAENATRYGDTGAAVFNSIVGNMTSAIENFVRTGKFSFKSLIQSMIQDLLVLQMRMLAMSMIRSIFMSFGGGAGSAAFGGTNGMALNTTGGFGSVATAADGGYINSPTLVGEHGPELFIPNRQGGTVVPTQQMAGMNNAPQVVYNGPYIQNMSAIDTQSATQFLASNKQAVWAANQSASRSLPSSR